MIHVDKRFPTVTLSRQRVSCLLTALAAASSRLAALLLPTPEVAHMIDPDAKPDLLIEPTVTAINAARKAAEDASPSDPPLRLNHHERGRIRAAIVAARRDYPEPIARVLVGELAAFDEIGFRWARPGTISPLIDHLLRPAPSGVEAA
jgi:hypothetical protein